MDDKNKKDQLVFVKNNFENLAVVNVIAGIIMCITFLILSCICANKLVAYIIYLTGLTLGGFGLLLYIPVYFIEDYFSEQIKKDKNE